MLKTRLAKLVAIILMRCAVCTGLFSSPVLADEHSAYEPVVPIDAEPRHHLVLTGQALRVFDVSFPPGAASLWHLHDKDSVLICLDGANVPSEEPGKTLVPRPPIASGDIYYKPYAKQPFVHRIRNVDSTGFRILDVEVLSKPQPPGPALEPLDRAWSVVLDNERVRVAKTAIAAHAATPALRLRSAHLLVAMTEGEYAVEPAGGAAQKVEARRGSLYERDAGGEAVLRNLGPASVELVLVEVK